MKILKRSIALILCAVMLLSMCACGKKKDESSSKDDNSNTQVQAISYTDQPSAVTKSETVYVSIDSAGKTTATTVTDWLHTDKAKVKVYDKSDLADIKNVKTYADPVKEGDSIVWNMDTTDLYYTGTTTKEAPVSFDIKYSLDGKEMSAKDIAGKSGHVEVTITMKNNCYEDRTVDGRTQRVYLPVLAAGGTILPESTFTGIDVKNGLKFGDGTKQIAAVAGAPGLCESLGITKQDVKDIVGLELSDTFTISADTECFELSNIYFAVIPFTSLDLDLIAPDSVSGLVNNLAQIKKVFSCLENMDLSSIMNLLSGNAGTVEELTKTINEAIALYDKNKALLKLGSKYCTDDNMKALSSLASSLNDKDFAKGLELLSGTNLDAVIESLPEVSQNLEKIAPLLKNETLSKALEILSSSVMVKFFKELPALSESLSSIQKLLGNKDVMDAINTLSDPSVAAMLQKLPGVMKDVEALAPLMGDLQKDMSDPEVQKAVENLPQTMKAISKLLNTVDKNSDVIDKLVSFASDENVKELVEILGESDIDVEELSKKFSSLVDNADTVAANAKEWLSFGESYGVLTQSTDAQQTNVVFIYNTPTIDKPAVQEEKTEQEETHWYTRILDLFRRKD